MTAALILSLVVGAGLPAAQWDAGLLAPDSEAVAEVEVRGPGAVEVVHSCDCLSDEILPASGGAGESTRVRLHLRPGARLGWHRTDVQIVQKAPGWTRIHRIPVRFELESLLPAIDPELVIEYGRDDLESARAVGELVPLLVGLGWTHAVYTTPGSSPLAVTERGGARTAGADAVRARLYARCADGERAPRAGAGEMLFFHDGPACSSAALVKSQVVEPNAARFGLTLRDLPLERPENRRLFCALASEAHRLEPAAYAAWAAERLFVAEPEIREILPRHLARAHGAPRLASAR